MKRILWIAGAVLALLAVIGWRLQKKHADESALQQSVKNRATAAVNVVLATAGPRDLATTLDAVGDVKSPNSVNLSPPEPGRILAVNARDGDVVTTGQVLVTIDPSQLQAMVLQAQADLASAQQRLAQAEITQTSTNVGVNTQIDQQKAAVNSADANYNQTLTNSKASVRAALAATKDANAKVLSAKTGVESANADITSAKASLAAATAKLNRVQALFDKGYVSQQDLEDAQTNKAVSQSAVEVANSKLDAAKAALDSAQEEANAAQDQLTIARQKAPADVAASKAQLDQSRAALKLAQSNTSQKEAYVANLNALRAGVRSAQAQLDQAKSRLGNTDAKSPVNGVVTQRSADPGSIASPGNAVLTIQTLDWVFVRGSVPIEESTKVEKGKTVSMTFDALGGKVLTGTIDSVDPSADPANRQFEINVKMENPTHELLPGMFAHMSIVLSKTAAAVAVPKEALTSKGDQATVTTVDAQNVAHIVSVKTGASDDAYVEILDGVKAGDRVIVRSYNPVKEGAMVSEGGGNGAAGGKGGGRKKGGSQ